MTIAFNTQWTPAMIMELEEQFYDYLQYLKIVSKDEEDEIPLIPFRAQQMFLDSVFEGMETDIHDFTVLKARQLGISTVSLALDLFWLQRFPGLRGALITDTTDNAVVFRETLIQYLNSLPPGFGATKAKDNATFLSLTNGSRLDYIVAGVKQSKGSGQKGRGKGLNFIHATECSSWGSPEGLKSIQASMSDKFPARLYIWESTARGFNIFHEMWETAKINDLSQKAIFIGWWAKDDYMIPRGTELFNRYGAMALTDTERTTAKIVWEKYGHQITDEQWAWYRWKSSPEAYDDSDDEETDDGLIAEGEEDTALFRQEYPSYEEEAFRLTAASFFDSDDLTQAMVTAKSTPFKAYIYRLGEDFFETKIAPVPAHLYRSAQLKVWAEPDPTGVYVIGADPAFGSSDEADRSVAQVFRCYADGLEQVAEFVSTAVQTYQFAWVLMQLGGIYSARLLLEITGPGGAVYSEFRNVKQILQSGQYESTPGAEGLANIVGCVKQYLYRRTDSMASNTSAIHWKTNLTNKAEIYNQFRDKFQTKKLRIYSTECLKEMEKIIQEGLTIKGDGSSKDDRPMAVALATRCWSDWERAGLIMAGRTREVEFAKQQIDAEDLQKSFSEDLVANFFDKQKRDRYKMMMEAKRGKRFRW